MPLVVPWVKIFIIIVVVITFAQKHSKTRVIRQKKASRLTRQTDTALTEHTH